MESAGELGACPFCLLHSCCLSSAYAAILFEVLEEDSTDPNDSGTEGALSIPGSLVGKRPTSVLFVETIDFLSFLTKCVVVVMDDGCDFLDSNCLLSGSASSSSDVDIDKLRQLLSELAEP